MGMSDLEFLMNTDFSDHDQSDEALICSYIRSGYGIEDIAVCARISVGIVRRFVRELQASGEIHDVLRCP